MKKLVEAEANKSHDLRIKSLFRFLVFLVAHLEDLPLNRTSAKKAEGWCVDELVINMIGIRGKKGAYGAFSMFANIIAQLFSAVYKRRVHESSSDYS